MTEEAPTPQPRRSWRLLDEAGPAGKYGWVIVLLCLVYAVTAAADTAGGYAVVVLVQSLTLWLVFAASESHRAQRAAGAAAVAAAVGAVVTWGLGWAYDVNLTGQKILSLGSVALYLVAIAVIGHYLIRRPAVDARTLFGAVAIYLMLGLVFAFAYRSISLIQTDPAFFGAAGSGDSADFLFFSFVTLTTTGYGNLIPETNPGQSVAVLEVIIGQLFLVTAVAKVVGSWRVRGTAPDGEHD